MSTKSGSRSVVAKKCRLLASLCVTEKCAVMRGLYLATILLQGWPDTVSTSDAVHSHSHRCDDAIMGLSDSLGRVTEEGPQTTNEDQTRLVTRTVRAMDCASAAEGRGDTTMGAWRRGL